MDDYGKLIGDTIRQYLHVLVVGLAVFTVIGMFLLFRGFYLHHEALSEARRERSELVMRQGQVNGQVADIEKQMAEHEKKIRAIINAKSMTPDELKNYFQLLDMDSAGLKNGR